MFYDIVQNKVEQNVKEGYEHLKGKQSMIFCTMLYGSQNYCLDTDNSDVDTKMLIVPSVKDVILGNQKYSHDVATTYGLCDIKDYRLMFKEYEKCNINFVETLFTPFEVHNPFFEDEFAELRRHANLIGNMDPIMLMKTAVGMAKNKYAMMTHPFPSKTAEIEKYGYDPKQLHHLCRLMYFINDYMEKHDFDQCLIPNVDVRHWLISLKLNPPPLHEAKEWADLNLDLAIQAAQRDMWISPEEVAKQRAEVHEFFDDLTERIFKKTLQVYLRDKGV